MKNKKKEDEGASISRALLTPPVVLAIGGFDGSGGAGLQADLKTISALGGYAFSVVTSVPVQSFRAGSQIYALPQGALRAQLEVLSADVAPRAVKIGMLERAETVHEVAEWFLAQSAIDHKPAPRILDPVLLSSSGQRLLSPSGLLALQKVLCPLVDLITPNLPEAYALLDQTPPETISFLDMERLAQNLLALGSRFVLLKGGHLPLGHPLGDYLLSQEAGPAQGPGHWFFSERVLTRNTRGTGCTLSSAIATFLAQGLPLMEAISQAKAYLSGALLGGKEWDFGEKGPLNHFFRLPLEKREERKMDTFDPED